MRKGQKMTAAGTPTSPPRSLLSQLPPWLSPGLLGMRACARARASQLNGPSEKATLPSLPCSEQCPWNTVLVEGASAEPTGNCGDVTSEGCPPERSPPPAGPPSPPPSWSSPAWSLRPPGCSSRFGCRRVFSVRTRLLPDTVFIFLRKKMQAVCLQMLEAQNIPFVCGETDWMAHFQSNYEMQPGSQEGGGEDDAAGSFFFPRSLRAGWLGSLSGPWKGVLVPVFPQGL
ncbi:uncharacterized protein LOC116663042 isoform X1 [Camelus ferus]|uniref:Uncharacterized protein LOC116663042 isoform X1 n=1 Tax=Camelus ferus TaxID=419612 RepID=A0A8B8STX2_CAMFR|nr:uncharacterized protein LOC116663042 isoform X1 [Camelus ferus]